MDILNYLLCLIITLMVAFPFVIVGAGAIISSYFMYKEKHISKLAAASAKVLGEMAKKEKENA